MNRSTRIMITRRIRRRAEASRTPGWVTVARITAIALVAALILTLVSTAAAAAVAGGVYVYFTRDLPDPSSIVTEQEHFETVKIYDRTGQHLLFESIDPRPFRGDRTYMALDEISPYLINATVALEDRSFWTNPGVNPRGIARAFVQNVQGGQIQGASSITQQLIKQNFFTLEEQYERSYTRKIKEALMAVELTNQFSKEQILEWYLNNNFYGNFSYGIESASQIYFGKSASEIDLAEASMLAALPQFPGLNPIQAPEDAKRRQGKVLTSMVEAGYITQEQADAAFAEELQVRESALERFDIDIAPHFALYALEEVKRKFNTPEDPFFIWRNGLTVITTLDVDMQEKVACIARQRIAHVNGENPDLPGCEKLEPAEGIRVIKNDDEAKVSNAAAVVLDAKTGEILAMLGSLDYNNAEIDGEVNIALADRQPGSSFKPLTYLTGFSQGLNAATAVMDVRQVFPDAVEPYTPENYDRNYHGVVSLRDALQRSYNIPAVWVMNQVGVKNVVNMAHRMGITSLNKDYYGLSLTLGGGEVKLLDMAYVFATLANNGVMKGEAIAEENLRPGYRTLDPVSVLEVRDRTGSILYKYDGPDELRVISPQLGYLMDNILSDPAPRPAAFGIYSRYLQLPDRPIIAKTGTTNDYRDSWTLGASPQIAVGVWVGNADNAPMDRISGSVGAAPIFYDIMEAAHEGMPVEGWEEPEGMVRKTVCVDSGLLPTDLCQRRKTELFIAGTEPTTYDNVYQVFEINRENGRLATPYTPPELIERRVYRVYPPVAADWANEQAEAGNLELPPREFDDTYGAVFTSEEVAIAQPAPFSYVKGGFDILGNARNGDFRLYQLHFGQGLQPQNWQQIGPDHYNQVDRGPLEYWDTTGLNGPFTLRLSVIENSGNVRQNAIPLTVDNDPPTVNMIGPANGRTYVMEDDEWVNLNALATDDWSMDKVVFYLDDSPIVTTTVAPYNARWTIKMVDRPPSLAEGEVRATEIITNADGTVTAQEKIVSSVTVDPNEPNRVIKTFDNGFGIIHDSGGYTETHVFKAVAFDTAGNEQESEEVRIFVQHEKDKGPKPRAALDPPKVALLPQRRSF
ncbi:MAG: transglycosylase domain-containing protein [Caldilineales bacterium]|nr:transglycosylase domain-containing protein [Caldilineales bacterium]